MRLIFIIFFSSVLILPGFPQTDSSKISLKVFHYRPVGPTRGGRVTTVEGVVSRPGTFYMGSTGGGVWKTLDYGLTWDNVSDGYFETPSIGAIRVVQGDPETVYVGTGTDGIRSNVITGKGMYKSLDGGKSWEHIGLENAGQIGAVEINPVNPDILFAAVIGQPFQPNSERGVYRSEDGGETWEHLLFLSDTIGAVDLEFAPDNPEIVYAAMWRVVRKPWTIISGGMQAGGIYKSVDGGDHWVKLTEGLPSGLIGKSDLAVSAADPSRLYVLMEAPAGEGGLYRSDNYGTSFTLVSTREELINRPFYYCNIAADPTNADVLYSLANRLMKSTDGGKRWHAMRPPHGDNHDIWINPENPDEFIESSDGGATITTNGGETWSTLFNQPTAELYQVEVDDQYPYWLYAGQQDNTTIAVPGLPPWPAPAGPEAYWLNVGGCETGPALPKPGDPDIVYANCKGRFGVYNKRTGQEQQYYIGATNIYGHDPDDLKYRFQRVAPIHVSPHNPNVVYMGSQYLHKTTDGGLHWEQISPDLTAHEPDKQVVSGSPITRDITGEEYYSTLYSIRESSLTPGEIWVGANDGPVHVTRDDGKTWMDVTPVGLPPGGRVDCVEPSPHTPGKAYIAVLRYQLGDWKPYIYRTSDWGKSWILITDGTNGIPAGYPTRVVREDPEKPGLLFAGTEYGAFVSFDDGITWHSFQQNLPVTPVTDIKIFRNDLILSTMGRGFWIADNIASLRQIKTVITSAEPVLFQPPVTIRYRYRGTRQGDVPEYPPVGAFIDYYLPHSIHQFQLEIKDAQDRVVASFDNQHTSEQQNVATAQPMQFRSLTIDSSGFSDLRPGLHRVTWNMRYRGAWDAGRKRVLSGPMAAPGTYKVSMIADGKEYQTELSLILDPRVKNEGITVEDIYEEVALSLQIVRLQEKALILAADIKEQIAESGKKYSGKRRMKKVDQLKKLQRSLVTAGGPYPTPMLLDQINYLYSMLNRADQRPGQDATERFAALKQWYSTLEKEFSEILK